MFHVEHIPSRKMKCVMLILCLLTLAGCKSEDPNPELSDPIYKFLVDQGNTLRPALETERKKLEESESALSKMDVNTAERKQEQKNIQHSRELITRLQQEVDYNEIRRERRRVESRRSYKIAYSKGEIWPKPEEFDHFMTQQRLRSASLDWGKRVPKLQDRINAAWPKPDSKAKKAEKEPQTEGEH